MLQKMGNTGGSGVIFSLTAEGAVNGTKIGDEVSQRFGKAGAGDDYYRQAVGENFPQNLFTQGIVIAAFHHFTPFKKYTVCSCRLFAARATSDSVTASTACMYWPGVMERPLRAAVP